MAGVNWSGLWNIIPMVGIHNTELNEWYDLSGNCSVRKLGLDTQGGLVTLASKTRGEVEVFIAGARAMGKMISRIADPRE